MSVYNVDKLPFHSEVLEKLSYFVDLLQRLDNLELIVLFGSHARAEQTVESDLDILAITDGVVPRASRGELCALFEEKGADLIFYDREQFENSNCRLTREIRKDGVLLWKK